MTVKDLVSVIVPAYNARAYIAEAVRSAMDQTYENIEILIVDDASTDDTGTLAQELAQQDPRIRVLHHETNTYRAGALNTGIDHARGEYISFLDADDVYMPEKLERQVAYMRSHPSVSMVYGDYIIWQHDGFDDSKEGLEESVDLPEDSRAILVDAAQDPALEHLKPYQILGRHCGDRIIPSCSPLVRRVVFDEIRFDESLRVSQDYDLWFQIIGHGFVMRRLAFPTYKYRYHPGQISKETAAVEKAQRQIIDKIRAGAYIR